MKDFSLAISLLLLLVFVITPASSVPHVGITSTCPLSHHMFYLWFHAGWLHLLINIMFILEMGFFAHSVKWHCWFLALLIAMCAPAFSDIPVVGFSGVLYALSGFSFCFCQRKARPLCILLLLSLFQFAVGGIAVWLHLFCFVVAVLVGCVILPIHNFQH